MARMFIYVGILVVLVAVVFGAGEVSLQSATCTACHQQQGAYVDFMRTKLIAEKKGFSHELIACADCHIAGSPQKTAASRLRGLGHVVQYTVMQLDPRRPQTSGMFHRTRIPTENCRHCHLGSVHNQAVLVKNLPERLKKIGLVMDHRKHVLAREDTCAKCHERFVNDNNSPQANRMVAYSEVNHMACDACHTAASHAYRTGTLQPMTAQEFSEAKGDAWKRVSTNPRWAIAFPTELSCYRCHNGKVHYKTIIFEANCRTGNDLSTCQKCHPLMTKEFFEQYKKDRAVEAQRVESRSEPRSVGTTSAGGGPHATSSSPAQKAMN